MVIIFHLFQLHDFIQTKIQEHESWRPFSYPHKLRPFIGAREDPPKSCFLNSITWDFDEELSQTMPFRTPSNCPPNRSYVPPRLRSRLITWAHTSPTTGYPGTPHTYDLLREKYWWENMIHEILLIRLVLLHLCTGQGSKKPSSG